MIARSAKLILFSDITILLSNIVSSLIGARALGPAGRGDLLIVALWPPVVAMLAGVGLPSAYRYWMAREPQKASRLFSNAIIYVVVVGAVAAVLADFTVYHLIGQRSPEVVTLARIYSINIPAALCLDLMRGLLEGTRRFGWAGIARVIFFAIQAVGFATLWAMGHLTVATGSFTLIAAQSAAMLVALAAVWHQLRPRWQPSWEEFKTSLRYALRDYPGGIANFTTLRLDQLMLGATASSAAIGLYVVAVRLSEMTTLAADAMAGALMPEVAATRARNKADALLGRTFRLTLYMHALILVPLWLGAPAIIRLLFGASFVPATGSFRWLLVAAAVWGSGSILISGLKGYGYPGLSTVARFSAAVVTIVALLVLLPRFSIVGAAVASLIGYAIMFTVALIALIKMRNWRLWACFKPRRSDLPIGRLTSLVKFGQKESTSAPKGETVCANQDLVKVS